MRLHAPGNVEGIGADQADPHDSPTSRTSAARCAAGRSASHSGCSMCQSAGCVGDARARRSRRSAAYRRAPDRASRVPGSGSGGWMCCTQPRVGEAQVGRAAGRRRSRRPAWPGPAGIRVGSPKNVTGTPLADRSRSPTSGDDDPAVGSRSRSTWDGRARSPAGQRQDLHPERFPIARRTSRTATPVSAARRRWSGPRTAGRPSARRRPSSRSAATASTMPRPSACALSMCSSADGAGLDLRDDLVVVHRRAAGTSPASTGRTTASRPA